MTTETNKNESKTNSLELTQKVIEKAGKALAATKEEFQKRTQKRPAEDLIRHYIKEIDELSKMGASLNQIYERLNKAISLGISANSFAVYVRRVRKEVGSELYAPRKTEKRNIKDKEGAASATRAETTNAPEMHQEANLVVDGWNCDKCESEAVRRESTKQPGKFFWQCKKCGANYRDNNGELTSELLK